MEVAKQQGAALEETELRSRASVNVRAAVCCYCEVFTAQYKTGMFCLIIKLSNVEPIVISQTW